MALFLRGLDADELAALTDAMLRSGDVLDLSQQADRAHGSVGGCEVVAKGLSSQAIWL